MTRLSFVCREGALKGGKLRHGAKLFVLLQLFDEMRNALLQTLLKMRLVLAVKNGFYCFHDKRFNFFLNESGSLLFTCRASTTASSSSGGFFSSSAPFLSGAFSARAVVFFFGSKWHTHGLSRRESLTRVFLLRRLFRIRWLYFSGFC